MPKVMIIAGEPSGDAHATRLVSSLKNHNIEFYGMGGNKMQAAGVKLIENIKKTSVMGIFELLNKLPYLYQILFKLKRVLQTNPPDLLILVDYQAFNLKLAKTAKRLNIKTLFYIGPQVWAWRQYRVKKIKRIIDHMAVIFPFEVDFYQKHQISATYVGHPLIGTIKSNLTKQQFFNNYKINPKKKLVAFLPGSRSSEVINHLPIFNLAINSLSNLQNLTFVVSRYDKTNAKTAESFGKLPSSVKIVDEDYYEMISAADFAVVASGTATLETALLKTPMIMVVKVSKLSYTIYHRMIKTPFIAIVNIIAGREVIKELIQNAATSENIVKLVQTNLNNPKKLEQIQDGFQEVEQKLAVKPKESLADLVLQILNANSRG